MTPDRLILFKEPKTGKMIVVPFFPVVQLEEIYSGTVVEVVRYVVLHSIEVAAWIVDEAVLEEVRAIDRESLQVEIDQAQVRW